MSHPESDAEYDNEPTGHQVTPWAVQGIPEDAQRMGLDRNTVEGSMIAMVGALDGANWTHKVVAWMLLAVFVSPLVLTLLDWLGGL